MANLQVFQPQWLRDRDVSERPWGLKLPDGRELSLSELVSGAGVPGWQNYKSSSYQNWRKARAQLRAGLITRAYVLVPGDSTTEGGYTGALTGAVARSYVRRAADMLTAAGLPANWQNVMGNHRTDVQGAGTIDQADSRVTAPPTGWNLTNTFGGTGGIGGYGFVNNANANPLTFAPGITGTTPTIQTDSLDVFYLDGSNYSSLTVSSGTDGLQVPSTGAVTANTGSLKLKLATATYTKGLNIWKMLKTTAGDSKNLAIQGWSAYDSTVPSVCLLNCGQGSQRAAAFAGVTNWFDGLRQVTDSGSGLIAPLAIFNIGPNDYINGTAIDTYVANLTTTISRFLAAGTDVAMVIPVPASPSTASVAAQQAVFDAARSVAITFGLAYLDLPARIGDFAAANALGYYADGSVHPGDFGHADIAAPVAEFIRLA